MSWLVLYPLVLLAIYTLVFGVILKARWGGAQNDSLLDFALHLYSGLLLFSWFAEAVTTSSRAVLDNDRYVRQVVFPVEMLPLISVSAAAVSFLFGLVVLLLAAVVSGQPITANWAAIPLLLAPFVCLLFGLAWIVAALSVYLRDLPNLVSSVMPAFMFLAPVFYSLDLVPETLRGWYWLNPITHATVWLRDAVFAEKLPPPGEWLMVAVICVAMAAFGRWLFLKLSQGFGDVI